MIPAGDYHGHVHGWLGFLNWIWTGKVFEGHTVLNTIFGAHLIEGTVTEEESGLVLIHYRLFHMVDALTPTKNDGSTWDGNMETPFGPIRFSLVRTTHA